MKDIKVIANQRKRCLFSGFVIDYGPPSCEFPKTRSSEMGMSCPFLALHGQGKVGTPRAMPPVSVAERLSQKFMKVCSGPGCVVITRGYPQNVFRVRDICGSQCSCCQVWAQEPQLPEPDLLPPAGKSTNCHAPGEVSHVSSCVPNASL